MELQMVGIVMLPLMVLVLHEGSHALMARLLGVRLWGVVLGCGPVVKDRAWHGLNFRLRKYPILFSIAILDDQRMTRTIDILIALAPLLFGLLLWSLPLGRLLTYFNLLNLLPFPGMDGWHLMRPCRRPKASGH